MRKKLVSLVALFLFVLAPALAQEKRGPSTADERNKALAAIGDLEANPLGASAEDERKWLTLWLIEVPDVHVGVCDALIPGLLKKNKKQDSDILFLQLMYSSARYAIQHDGGDSESADQFEAGVEGTLRTYEALVTQRPKDRQPELDDLLQRRSGGTLSAYVKQLAKQGCKARD